MRMPFKDKKKKIKERETKYKTIHKSKIKD